MRWKRGEDLGWKIKNLPFLIIFLFGVFSVFFLLGVVIDFIILIFAFFESFHFSIFSKIFFFIFSFDSILSTNRNARKVQIQITGFSRVCMNHHWWSLCKVTLKLTLVTHSYSSFYNTLQCSLVMSVSKIIKVGVAQ